MKVAVFSTKSFDQEYFDRFMHNYSHELTYFEAPLHYKTVTLTKGFEAVCVFVNDTLDKRTVYALAENGIKLIALRCSGFNNVDVQAAQERDIALVRVPSYSPQAVAEHAVALLLTLNRKTHKAYNRIREGNFALERLTGFDIQGKTVGVIGTGQIGTIFSKIMKGFGCIVLTYDKYPAKGLEKEGMLYKPLNFLLEESDIISLHCPLTPETKHLIDKNAFSKMKKGVMLINTSRGALINTFDAIEALKNGTLGYLGIDVYEQEEKLFFRDLSESIIHDDTIARLMTFPNVLITAHQGFFTKEALEEITITTLQNISDFEDGKQLLNLIKL